MPPSLCVQVSLWPRAACLEIELSSYVSNGFIREDYRALGTIMFFLVAVITHREQKQERFRFVSAYGLHSTLWREASTGTQGRN